MNRKLFAALLLVLLCSAFAGCAAETRSPMQQAKIVADYAEARFAARMEAQGVAGHTLTGMSYTQFARDNTLYQVWIDYREGDGEPQTYSYVLRLEDETVVLLGEGDAKAMAALLTEEAG